MKIQDCIECPRCHKPFLKSYMGIASTKFGKGYFCHFCHTDFGVYELVHQWGMDAGDLFGDIVATPWAINSPVELEYPMPFEPDWSTAQERNDAYQMVSRMFLGVEEVDDYADLLATQDCALDIGVQ